MIYFIFEGRCYRAPGIIEDILKTKRYSHLESFEDGRWQIRSAVTILDKDFQISEKLAKIITS